MLQSNDAIVVNGDMSVAIISDMIPSPQKFVTSIQCVWTGAPTGTFYIEYSDDLSTSEGGSGVFTWIIAPNGTAGIVAESGKILFRTYSLGERWIRLRWAHTAGAGTLNARFNAKGF